MKKKKIENMARLFTPKSVAVIGASEKFDKLGFHVMKSLTKGGFGGEIIPVNPSGDSIMGIKSYPSLSDCPGPVDLAIIAVPAKLVPQIFEECAKKDVGGIVLITAGFREIDDPEGAALQEALARQAEGYGIPVIGPNTFGMVNLNNKLNASFTPEFSLLKRGKISLVSQSGGMSHLLSFMAIRSDIGFSKVIGLGNRLNINFMEMVDFLMDDHDTDVIALYMEGIDTPAPLMETIKRHLGKKPVVAYKTGSSEVGDMASRSHTGSLAGVHEIYSGAFRQAGVVVVDEAETFLDVAKALSAGSFPTGSKVAVLSGQAGPGMAACDAAEMSGLELTRFTQNTQQKINELLPPLALRTNPVDMGPAWYDGPAITEIVKAAMMDDNVDGVILLIMYASANLKSVDGISDMLIEWNQKKPIITCISAPPGIWDKELERLDEEGAVSNYPTPERAARVLARLWEYKRLQDNLE
jgi:acyl-CoA synthetase (NDP forming)